MGRKRKEEVVNILQEIQQELLITPVGEAIPDDVMATPTVKEKKTKYTLTKASDAKEGDLIEHEEGEHERFLVARTYRSLKKNDIYQVETRSNTYMMSTKNQEKGEGPDRIVFVYEKAYKKPKPIKNITPTTNIKLEDTSASKALVNKTRQKDLPKDLPSEKEKGNRITVPKRTRTPKNSASLPGDGVTSPNN